MQFCAGHEIPILHTDSGRRDTYLNKRFPFFMHWPPCFLMTYK